METFSIEVITATLAAGAYFISRSKDTPEIKELYKSLRKEIIGATTKSPEVYRAIELLENEPETREVKEFLERELYSVGIDESVLALLSELSEKLLKAIENEGYTASLTGSGAIAQGSRSVASGQGGVSIGGDVHGSVVITGNGNAITAPRPWPRDKK
jgi:hypothetical protein